MAGTAVDIPTPWEGCRFHHVATATHPGVVVMALVAVMMVVAVVAVMLAMVVVVAMAVMMAAVVVVVCPPQPQSFYPLTQPLPRCPALL